MSILSVTTIEVFLLNLSIYITSIGTAVAAIIAAKRGKANSNKIEEVHELVNSHSEKQEERIEQLGNSLTAAGVTIPNKEEGKP